MTQDFEKKFDGLNTLSVRELKQFESELKVESNKIAKKSTIKLAYALAIARVAVVIVDKT